MFDTITNRLKPPLSIRDCSLCVVGFALLLGTGCKPRPKPPGGATTPKAQIARKQAEAYVVDAVNGAAEAQQRSATQGRFFVSTPTPVEPMPWVTTPPTPEPTPLPRFQPKVVIREKVTTDVPFSTESKAEEEALRLAQQRIKERLESLDPPVHHTPSLTVVKNEYIRRDSRNVRRPGPKELERWADEGYTGDQVYVEYEVEITADQVRELRTQDRLGSTLRLFSGIVAIALGGLLFLRLDDWSKGYLTSWLAFLAAALVGGVAAALLLV